MSGEDKPRRRRLSEDEHVLWRGVTRSVAPLKRGPRAFLAAILDGASERMPKPVAPKRSRPAPAAKTGGSPSVSAGAKPHPADRSTPFQVFDRRHKRRLARGVQPIADRIDLHGYTQTQAHGALLAFLAGAQANGAKTVLVITGKGGGPDGLAGERGVLRRQVPHWLVLPAFRAYVAGVEEAHFAHGGPGALYVRVRRA